MKTTSLRHYKSRVIFGIVLLSLCILSIDSYAKGDQIYQLKVYTIENEKQELRMDKYLEHAFIPALHRAGIEHVGVFKPVKDDPNHGTRIYVLIPYTSIAQFEKQERVLSKDSNYQRDGADYIEASHDDSPYTRIESILLRAFKSMPAYGVPEHNTPFSERIYELRSYQGATEKIYEKKVEMFDDAGETKLFIDLGFQPVFFGEVISGPDMPNLMYLTTFENKTSQDQHWEAFRSSPVWTAMKSDPQYKNTVSHSDKYLLFPTVYSDL